MAQNAAAHQLFDQFLTLCDGRVRLNCGTARRRERVTRDGKFVNRALMTLTTAAAENQLTHSAPRHAPLRRQFPNWP